MFTPDISHYYARQVEAVEDAEDGWAIVLEGGVKIINTDPEYEKPEDILIDKKLSVAVMDENITRLFFGTDEDPRQIVMYLTATNYGISDPEVNDGAVVYPQSTQAEVDAAFPPSSTGTRDVTGPDSEYLRRSSEPDPEYTPDEEHKPMGLRGAESDGEATDEPTEGEQG